MEFSSTTRGTPTHGPPGSIGLLDDRPDLDTLTWIARHAWRMADRCVGRSGWKSLIVRDCTRLTEAEEIVEASKNTFD